VQLLGDVCGDALAAEPGGVVLGAVRSEVTVLGGARAEQKPSISTGALTISDW